VGTPSVENDATEASTGRRLLPEASCVANRTRCYGLISQLIHGSVGFGMGECGMVHRSFQAGKTVAYVSRATQSIALIGTILPCSVIFKRNQSVALQRGL
jgi:hypothetical protein